jgi:hypothetical protein
MATLTEKEITIEAAGVHIELWADYLDNGNLWEITATVDIDGHRIKEVRIHDGLKLTSFYGAMLLAFHPEVTAKLESEVKKLVNLNEN